MSFIQISRVRGEGFFQSGACAVTEKEKQSCSPGRPCPWLLGWFLENHGGIGPALKHKPAAPLPGELRGAGEVARAHSARPASTGRLRALVRKRHGSGRLHPPGRDKRGPRWRPAATGVSLSSVRNGRWTRPNGAGTWALTCGSG